MVRIIAPGNVKQVKSCVYCGGPLRSHQIKFCQGLCQNLHWHKIFEEHLARPGVRPTIPGAWDYVKGARISYARNRCERCDLTLDRFVDNLRGEYGYTIMSKEEFRSYASSLYSLEAHHVIPIYRGGNSSIENIIVLCGTCHKQAHKKMPGKKIPIRIKREDTRQMRLF